jgi:hypothetical protein
LNPQQGEQSNLDQAEIIYSLLKSYPVVTNTLQLQAILESGLKKPFDRGIVQGKDTILIPDNIEVLVRDNYLFRLYLDMLRLEKVNIVKTELIHTTRMKLDSQGETFLKAFGIGMSTGQFPKLPTNKGPVWKGVMSSVRTYMSFQKNVDNSLLKGKEISHPALIIFGDVWAKAHPTEKRMLDSIIHHYRTHKVTCEDPKNYMIGKDQIDLTKGLKIDYSSEALTETERSVINHYLRIHDISCESELLQDTSSGPVDIFQTMSTLTKAIKARQQAIRSVKDLVKGIISSRVSSCYAPYTGRQREKVRKTPIKELINQIKGTEHYHTFNPTRVGGLFNLPNIPAFYPVSTEEKQRQLHTEKIWLDSAKKTEMGDSLSSSILQEYQLFLENCKKV